jgi:hypothetical protein
VTRARQAALALAVVFFALHLPFLPASLEDLDSINFGLALRRFDVAAHQPHPPGYPVYVALGRVVHLAVPNEAKALGALSVLAATAGAFAIFAMFRRVDREWPAALACAAAAIAATAPLYWFTAVRPLSDMTGLAASIALQAWMLGAGTIVAVLAAALCAGFAAGIRSQVVWLTLPLLVYVVVRWRGDQRTALARRAAGAYAVGAVGWAVPLVILSGGPAAYWRAVAHQGAEDLSGVQMLWTTPTIREFLSALYYAFVAPWALWSVAAVVLVFAGLGAALLARYARRPALVLAVAFGPYFFFDLLFQETFTTRYALPLVVPVAYLAARGAAAFGWRPGMVVAIALAAFDAHIGGMSIAGYARDPAPAFRMLDDMRASPWPAPVIAMDRRESLDLRRPLAWFGDERLQAATRLPSPPQHEWLEAAGYWARGGERLWYVADPLRTDVDLFQHPDPVRYRWSLDYPELLGGIRPNIMDWYRLDRPEWFVGRGWALTPEAGGVSKADGVGLEHGAVSGAVRGDAWPGGALAIGGRNFDAVQKPRLTVRIGTQLFVREMMVAPGPFVDVIPLPAGPAGSPARYDDVTITSDPPARVAVEQFDVSNSRVVSAFGAGWHEQEYNPATGLRWRWLSERGDLLVHAPGRIVRLHLEGESPRRYFAKASHLVVRAGGRVALDESIAADFSYDVILPRDVFHGPVTTITVETDQVYVPAERSSRSPDRRHLGLRIFRCELRAGDGPAS